MDSDLCGLVLFEDGQGDALYAREVFGAVLCADAALVLSEAYLEGPMEFVLDAPVLADDVPRGLGGTWTGAGEVAALGGGFSAY